MCTGAYFDFISIVASVRSPAWSSLTTLPTGTPEIRTSAATLAHGEALLLYTDGVVETRTADLDRGVTWLQHEAQEAVHDGFGGAAVQILRSVESEDDDRQPWRGIDVGSPFDYARQAILYVARHLPPPGRDGLGQPQDGVAH